MYLLKTYFQSHLKGIYTKEEETAKDEYGINYKTKRMLQKWIKILCPNINDEKVSFDNTEYILSLIELEIKEKNRILKQDRILYNRIDEDDVEFYEFKFEVIEI